MNCKKELEHPSVNQKQEQIVMGRHISDTGTTSWEVYYVYLQSSRRLHYLQIPYTKRQAVARRFATAKVCGQTYVDRQIGTELLRTAAVQQSHPIISQHGTHYCHIGVVQIQPFVIRKNNYSVETCILHQISKLLVFCRQLSYYVFSRWNRLQLKSAPEVKALTEVLIESSFIR